MERGSKEWNVDQRALKRLGQRKTNLVLFLFSQCFELVFPCCSLSFFHHVQEPRTLLKNKETRKLPFLCVYFKFFYMEIHSLLEGLEANYYTPPPPPHTHIHTYTQQKQNPTSQNQPANQPTNQPTNQQTNKLYIHCVKMGIISESHKHLMQQSRQDSQANIFLPYTCVSNVCLARTVLNI